MHLQPEEDFLRNGEKPLILSRNWTKAEIISVEVGEFSKLAWAEPVEGPHVLYLSFLAQPGK